MKNHFPSHLFPLIVAPKTIWKQVTQMNYSQCNGWEMPWAVFHKSEQNFPWSNFKDTILIQLQEKSLMDKNVLIFCGQFSRSNF